MFIGTFRGSIDINNRLSIPVIFREELHSQQFPPVKNLNSWPRLTIFLAPLDGLCLGIYGPKDWQLLVDSMQNENLTSKAQFNYEILGRAVGRIIDTSGRIVIPKDLQKVANISKQVLLIGLKDRIELWSPEKAELRQRLNLGAISDNITTIPEDEHLGQARIISRDQEAKPLIFISYAHDDANLARRIYARIRSLGLEPFLDVKDITWGTDFRKEIEDKLSASSAVIVIISSASAKSQWVAYEVGHARGIGKLILPFVERKSFDPPGFLAGIQHVSTLQTVEDQLRKQFRLIKRDE